MNPIVDEVSSRFGVPVDFAGQDATARTRYIRETNRQREMMPAGECRVAPRVSLTSERGRPIESGTIVTAATFGENEVGRFRLEGLILSGHVLRSEQQSEAELAEIAAHVQHVRELNAAFTGDTVAAKLDRLLEQSSK